MVFSRLLIATSIATKFSVDVLPLNDTLIPCVRAFTMLANFRHDDILDISSGRVLNITDA